MMVIYLLSLSLLFLPSMYFCLLGTTFLSMTFLLKSFSSLKISSISGEFMLDNLSWSLVSLSIWIILMILIMELNYSYLFQNSLKFQFFLFSLLLILILAFTTSSTMKFYFWFELSLIPTFMLILGWGYQPERVKASFYLILYMISASLPLFLILNMKANDSNFLFFFSSQWESTELNSLLIFFGSMIGFSVKLPLFFVHLWLIKAHVEAPVSGSMLLASLLLKLGGYGAIRISSLLPANIFWLWEMMMIWSLVGGVYVSLICLRQTDVKALIALSSVAHMALVMAGICSQTKFGLNGALLIMLAHGFTSSGLFFIANLGYLHTNSRNFFIFKGFLLLIPNLSMWWFILTAANMSAPPSMNLFGEIHVLISLIYWSKLTWVPIACLTFFAVAYSLTLYLKSQHGSPSNLLKISSTFSTKEMIILFMHIFPICFLSLKWTLFI